VSAIALTRQLATLLLDLYDIQPDYSQPISNDWYRQALDYRVPRGEGETLRAALGGIGRSQFSRIQALLALPDPVWELADRYRLEEKRLRYLLRIDEPALQYQVAREIIRHDLSAERTKQLVESGELVASREGPAESRPSADSQVSESVINRWSRLVRDVPRADLMRVAEQWVRREKPDDIRKQVELLRKLLDLVEQRIDEDDA
jgi:hypothetical protein